MNYLREISCGFCGEAGHNIVRCNNPNIHVILQTTDFDARNIIQQNSNPVIELFNYFRSKPLNELKLIANRKGISLNKSRYNLIISLQTTVMRDFENNLGNSQQQQQQDAIITHYENQSVSRYIDLTRNPPLSPISLIDVMQYEEEFIHPNVTVRNNYIDRYNDYEDVELIPFGRHRHREATVHAIPQPQPQPRYVNPIDKIACFAYQQEKKEDDCPICYDCVEPNKIITTGCNHSFCGDCVVKMVSGKTIRMDLNPNPVWTCPICRSVVNELHGTDENYFEMLRVKCL